MSELIDTCAKHDVGHVVLAGGLPPGGAIDRIKAQRRQADLLRAGAGLAKKLMRSGADALVIEGMEAGGHIGPVATSVLAQEILPHIAHDMPVFVAGGIGRGEAIAAYLEMGAVGVQLGTRFVCATRKHRPRQFQEGLHPRLGARRDSLASRSTRACRSSRSARSKNREMENFAAKQREVAQLLDEGAIEMAEAQLQIEHYWAGALRRAVIDGDVESGSVMAGQSVGMVNPRGAGRRDHPRAGRRGAAALEKPRLAASTPMADQAAALIC